MFRHTDLRKRFNFFTLLFFNIKVLIYFFIKVFNIKFNLEQIIIAISDTELGVCGFEKN